jgi:hypothetical protein
MCSAATKSNIEEIWKVMFDYWKVQLDSGRLEEMRGEQEREWMHKMVLEELQQEYDLKYQNL